MSGNKPRTLVFSAKRDGVHGMVAGSTGSGKSELLISLYHRPGRHLRPDRAQFCAGRLQRRQRLQRVQGRLPHCVDMITNLGEDGVARMFTAIRAEMERRQAAQLDTGTKNIVDYRQKGFHETARSRIRICLSSSTSSPR